MPLKTELLSNHSSNPLEASPSDNSKPGYNRQLANARLLTQVTGKTSEDDDIPFYEGHVEHTAKPASRRPSSMRNAAKRNVISLESDDQVYDDDEIMPDEHELAETASQQQRSEKPVSRQRYQSAQEQDLEGEIFDEDEVMDDEVYEEAMSDEETTIELKPPQEQEEIREEIQDLEDKVSALNGDYTIIDRLGTGTFSSVYKAIDLGYHDKWDNASWHGRHPPESSAYYQSAPRPQGQKVYVAVKRIYVTSNPERIRNEIAVLQECRGCRHTSQLITSFREKDQVVVVMPYQRNVDFREYYRSLPMPAIKSYFRCLFRALRDVHARSIIHRDVKPANFLFDPITGIGTLCDFGLASRIEPLQNRTLGSCLHTSPTREHPHGVQFDRKQAPTETKRRQNEARAMSRETSDKVGYLAKDPRPHSKANRAGTRGFRAPEVLLKCGDQSGAIDVWAAGTILLFFLSGKFPLFQSNDDMEALLELSTILGRRTMEYVATLHSRTFATNVPSVPLEAKMTWQEFVEKLNPDIYTPKPPDNQYYPYTCSEITPPSPSEEVPPLTSSSPNSRSSRSLSPLSDSFEPHNSLTLLSPVERHRLDLENAYDFLNKVLEPRATARMTARDALYHPFLAPNEGEEPSDLDMDDDAYFPHPYGEGVCGHLHHIDDVTGELSVRLDYDDGTFEFLTTERGEGIAIGRRSCEFHEYLIDQDPEPEDIFL